MNTVAEKTQEQKQNETIEATQAAVAATIEYGGLIWTKTARDAEEYVAVQPECGYFRIYQYPLNGDSYSAGKWLWSAHFDTLVPRESKPAILDLEASAILEHDMEEAMQACIDAKEKLIADIKQLAVQLGIGNYPTGYMDGQAALAKKIALVLP